MVSRCWTIMFWYCYNCGKKNKNEDKICANCFRERILINPQNIDEKKELQEKNNNPIFKKNISSSEPSTDLDSCCKNSGFRLEDSVSECPKCDDTFTDDSETINKKKKNAFYYIIITLAISFICYVIVKVLRFNFPHVYAWILENLVFSPLFTVFCLVITIIVCVRPSKKSVQKENSENVLDEDRNIIENNNPNPIMLIIGLVPFILLFLNAAVSFFINGFEAFIFTLLFYFIIFSPIFICSIVMIISYIKYADKKNK